MLELQTEELSVSAGDRSLIVTFIRPVERNPLSIALLKQLREIVDGLARENAIEKLIFTGTGDVFASGADLREIAAVTGETAREYALRGQTLITAIAALPHSTIAAVNGYCFGGALDLALACDERIAAPQAVFCHPGAGLGIMTGWGGTQRLPRLVGEAAALEMLMTAKRVTAVEALTIGLIGSIAADPVEAAMKL